MPTLNLTNYTHAAAKAIINRLYGADKSASIQNNGLALRGTSIMADAMAVSNGYEISISSAVYEEATLKELVEEGLNAL